MTAQDIYKRLSTVSLYDRHGKPDVFRTIDEAQIQRILDMGRKQGLELACAMYVEDGNLQIWRDKVVNALEDLAKESAILKAIKAGDEKVVDETGKED